MSLVIHPINLGEVVVPADFLVMSHEGPPVQVPCFGFLITGGEEPVVVDTGYRDPQLLVALGLTAERPREMTMSYHLEQHGLTFKDIRYVVHTHAHVDHAGCDDLFPMSTPVCLARRELEFSASGIQGWMYPADDVKHLIDRLHIPGALRLFDVDGSFEEEVIPGMAVRRSGAHTEGSLSILVQTEEGLANICGDIVYDVYDSLVTPYFEANLGEPRVPGNRGLSQRDEKTAIKKALSGCHFLLPSHDTPAAVAHGNVVGRLEGTVPGPVTDTRPRLSAPSV